MGYIYGNASYFCSCCGGPSSCLDTPCGGACGDCNDQANHFAWSNLTTTGCYYYCTSGYIACPLACGDSLYVYNYCGTGMYGYAESCCPCSVQGGCPSALPPCDQNSTFGNPLLDCTEAFYASLGGDFSQGRIPVAVYCP